MKPRTPALLLCALLAAGCGQTGPLYLPDENVKSPVEIRPAVPAPATPAPAAPPEEDEAPKPPGSTR